MTTEPPLWYVDPDTLQLAGGPPGPMSRTEFQRQAWPCCPVCRRPIDVDGIDVTSLAEPTPRRYVVGRWECPNGCDPRTADPRRQA